MGKPDAGIASICNFVYRLYICSEWNGTNGKSQY